MDLLELPEPDEWGYPSKDSPDERETYSREAMHSYARANLAARQSEAEAILREIVDKAPHVTGEAWDAIWARARAWRDSHGR